MPEPAPLDALGAAPSAGPAEPAARWLEEHGDALYRFARARVGRRELAEDLVQDTLVAALMAREAFREEATVRTWLLAILRRKVADHHRRRAAAAGTDADAGRGRVEAHVFTDAGWFRHRPSSWRSAPEACEAGELWEVVDRCLGRLPSRFAEVFTLRELDELPADAIRRQLGLSAGNLRVRLYRARLLLRECLEQNWFATDPDGPR
jgi:RNA polymerase sigma-70 factor (ECF subfamily)